MSAQGDDLAAVDLGQSFLHQVLERMGDDFEKWMACFFFNELILVGRGKQR